MSEQKTQDPQKKDKGILFLKALGFSLVIVFLGIMALSMLKTSALHKNIMEQVSETMEDVSSEIDDASYEVVE